MRTVYRDGLILDKFVPFATICIEFQAISMKVKSKNVPAQFSEIEWFARVELAACYRLADIFGFSDLIWNHITSKIPGTEHFLINRFGFRYDEVTASNLVTIDLDGDVVESGSGTSAEDINLTGFVIHSAIHAARPDITCVMHTHSRAGIVVSTLTNGLVPMTIDAMPFYNRVAYHDFEGLSVDLGERTRLAQALGDQNAMILRNHGLLTCGKEVSEAFMKMYYLERACEVQLRAQATGQDIHLPTSDICEKTAMQSNQFSHGAYEWPALLRLVDKTCPDYKT